MRKFILLIVLIGSGNLTFSYADNIATATVFSVDGLCDSGTSAAPIDINCSALVTAGFPHEGSFRATAIGSIGPSSGFISASAVTLNASLGTAMATMDFEALSPFTLDINTSGTEIVACCQSGEITLTDLTDGIVLLDFDGNITNSGSTRDFTDSFSFTSDASKEFRFVTSVLVANSDDAEPITASYTVLDGSVVPVADLSAPAPVPEPSSFMLLLSCLAVLGIVRSKSRKAEVSTRG